MKHFDPYKFNKTREQYIELIDSYIFSQRDRDVLKRRLLDGITYEKLGEEFELSVTQVKNIIIKHEKTLFKHI